MSLSRADVWRWLAQRAHRFGDWCDATPQTLLRIPHDAVYATALSAAERLELESPEGEWKRHQLYAQLLRAFPHIPRRALAQAIEAAVKDL